jgi:hypothetical protein
MFWITLIHDIPYEQTAQASRRNVILVRLDDQSHPKALPGLDFAFIQPSGQLADLVRNCGNQKDFEHRLSKGHVERNLSLAVAIRTNGTCGEGSGFPGFGDGDVDSRRLD